jgi:hypothetical protein
VDIKTVLDASTVTAYTREIEKLKAAIDFQDGALAELAAAEEEYHFTANTGAADLYRKYQLLIGAGYDQATVLDRQSKGWQKLVSDGLMFGTVLPGQVKGIIEKLIEMGQITDENGNLLTDISRLRFADVGQSGYDAFAKMTASIDKLVAAIKLSLGLALSDVDKQLLGIALKFAGLPEYLPGAPGSGDFDPMRGGGNTVDITAATAGGSAVVVHTAINLDGRTVAKVVSAHQMDSFRNATKSRAA